MLYLLMEVELRDSEGIDRLAGPPGALTLTASNIAYRTLVLGKTSVLTFYDKRNFLEEINSAFKIPKSARAPHAARLATLLPNLEF